jgi:gliding motility-associated-like protein
LLYPHDVKVRNYLLLIFYLLVYYNTNAQTPTLQWEKSMGGPGADSHNDIKTTADGNFIAVGFSTSNSGNISGAHGGIDAYVTKFTKNGTTIWSKLFGGNLDEAFGSIIQTPDGGYICVGYTTSNNDNVSGNHGSYDIWVVKLAGDGTLQWQKCFGGSNYDRGGSIIPTNDGNYLIAGSTNSTDGDVQGNHGNTDYWLFKISPSGNLLWQKCFGGSYSETPSSVIQTSDNGFIVCGSTSSNDGDVSGSHNLPNSYNNDSWVVKLDGNGNLQWQKCYGGVGFLAGASQIIQTTWGDYFILGNIFLNVPSITSGDITTYYGNYDIWGIDIDNNGTIQWQKTLGGTGYDRGNTVINTSDGQLLLVGGSSSNNHDISGGHGGNEYLAIKLNSIGTIQWQLCLGGSSSEEASSVLQTGSCEYILTGSSGSSDGQVNTNYGGSDAWVVDIATILTPSATISSSAGSNVCQGTPVTFTAIPFNGGTSPAYQWQKNGLNVGSNSPTYADNSLSNNDAITVVMTNTAPCTTTPTATSNPIVITVTIPLTPSVSISSDAGSSICQGAPVTFTATPVNGGPSPAYQWQKNGLNVGNNSPTYSDNSLSSNDAITVVMTSTAACTTTSTATSSPIVISVTIPLTPSVSISSDAGSSICQGTPVTFTATPVNGGPSPAYQWQKNGLNVGNNSPTYSDNSLSNNDAIKVLLTSNTPCTPTATSTSLTIIVTTPVTPSVSITSSAGTNIYQGTPVTFTAIPINGGVSPIFQWKKNGVNVGSNSPIYTDNSLSNNDVITVTITSSIFCTTITNATAGISINILPIDHQMVKIPNTFTPNSDGINDTWDIKHLEYFKKCTVNIFTRKKQLVFSSIGYPVPWDGTFKGAAMPNGVYYYIIDLKDGSKPFASWLTVIR